MSADMKASVLLTLKIDDQIGGKGVAAIKGIEKGIGAAAKEASALAGAVSKAWTATAETAGAADSIGSAFAAATKQADAFAAAAARAGAASQKAASAAAYRPTGDDIYASAAAHDAAVKSSTPLMPVPANAPDHVKAAAIANNLERANPALYVGRDGSAKLEKHVGDELERMKSEAQGSGRTLGQKAQDAFFAVAIAKMATHSADHVISEAGDVTAMREKIKWAMGGDKASADQAYDKAMQLSGKYKNTTVLENLHIIDDLRANLPESFDKILSEAADPFVRMHSFFKAWEGGAHKGKADSALKDIGAAIRAGELTGISSAEDLVKHTQALATAKILFGEKFNVGQYFQATQKAATALSAADDTFKYIDFPILLQRLSQSAGVALRTGFQKYVAGATMSQQTAENWRKLGMVDMDKVELDKKTGKIKAASLLGKPWLKDGDAFSANFADATMTKLLPHLVNEGGLTGLTGLSEAWKAGDAEKAAHIMSEFRKDKAAMAKLSQLVIGLAKDPSAAKLLEETITGSPSNIRDRERAKAIEQDNEKYASYEKSKQQVSAQADRLLQAVSGEDLSGAVSKALDGVSSALGSMADAVSKAKAKWAKGEFFGAAKGALKPVGDLFASDDGRVVSEDSVAGKAWSWLKDKTGYGDQIYGPPAPTSANDNMPDVPTLVGSKMAGDAAGGTPQGVTIQANGPQVTFNQAPPNISVSVTVNATTNASPEAIGSAVAGQVRSALGGAMHDGGQ